MKKEELHAKLNRALTQARSLLELREAKWTDEDEAQYKGFMAEHDETRAKLDRMIQLEEAEARMASVSERRLCEGAESGEERASARDAAAEYREGIAQYLRTGAQRFEVRDDSGAVLETRSLQADSDTKGGFLIGQVLSEMIYTALDNIVHVRGLATIERIPVGSSLGTPTLDTDVDDMEWTSEVASAAEDTAMALGVRELKPYPLAKLIKVSRTLVRAKPAFEGYLMGRVAAKAARTMENAYLNGNGVGRPLGLFVASANGIPTSRDVSTGNTTTAVTFDNLMEVKGSLKEQYLRNAQSLRWLGSRQFYTMVSKLKDGENQYLWQPSKIVGDPDTLLGVAIARSEYAPSTFTASQYVAVLGDMSQYWIADAEGDSVQTLLELYARTNQVGYIWRGASDGMPWDSAAFARVQLAAS